MKQQIIIYALITLCLSWCVQTSQAEDVNLPSESLTTKLEELEKNLEHKKKQSDILQKQETTIKSKLKASSKWEDRKERDVTIYGNRLKKNEESISIKTAQLNEVLSEVFFLEKKLNSAVKSLKAINASSSPILLPNQKVSSARQAAFLRKICKYDYLALKEAVKRRDSLYDELSNLEENRKKMLLGKREAEYSYGKFSNQVKTREKQINDIKKKKIMTSKEINELEKAQKELTALLLKSRDRSQTTNEIYDKILETNFELARGILHWPMNGEVVRKFSDEKSKSKNASSSGIDIKSKIGVEIEAVAKGRVIFADKFSTFGNVVILEHSREYCSLYANLAQLYVEKDDIVNGRTPIGMLDKTNSKDEYILHFEISKSGKPVDPLVWLVKR